MDQSEKRRKSSLKETKSKKPLELEDSFAGFDANDEITNIIEIKTKRIKNIENELNKKSGSSLDVEEPSLSQPIFNYNSVMKKNQSIHQLMYSPENNCSKNYQSVKKPKKDNLQTELMDSLETHIQPSLELTTPTFNLTSTPRSRRKTNTDISNPVFKLPFDYGWKRELVYRTSGDSTSISRTNRSGDVYYYSPNKRKLRSLREIQEQLESSLSENVLTIESFTFLKQPIGLNDPSKELIRDANSKLSRDDNFVGGVKSKKPKTPIPQSVIDFDLSDDENTKTSNKMKIVFKNVKKSKPKKDDKNDLQHLNSSTSTTDIMPEERQACQSNSISKVSSPKPNDTEVNSTDVKRRSSSENGLSREINNPLIMHVNDMHKFIYMGRSLRQVFSYLNIREFLAASRVCQEWRMAAMHTSLWRNVRLKNATICDWNKLVESIMKHNTISLDTRRMLLPPKVQDFERFWIQFSQAIKLATSLEVLELYRCPVKVVSEVMCSLPQLTKLNATSIKNPYHNKESKTNELMSMDIDSVYNMTNLTELKLKGLTGIKLMSSTLTFENLTKLKTLSLTSIKSFPKDIFLSLNTLSTDLETFEIGDCDSIPNDLPIFIKKLSNLKKLRLENCVGKWEKDKKYTKDVFNAIRTLKKLRTLELVNINFNDCVEEGLEKCDGITALLIIPMYNTQSATTNCHLVDCLRKLSKTLTHVAWGLTNELLRVTDLFIAQYTQNKHNLGYRINISETRQKSNSIPILRTRKPKPQPGDLGIDEIGTDMSDNVDILSVQELQTLLKTIFVNAKAKVVKTPFSVATRIYLSDHFDDL